MRVGGGTIVEGEHIATVVESVKKVIGGREGEMV